MIKRDYFPYFTRGKTISITRMELYARDPRTHDEAGDVATATADLSDANKLAFAFTADAGPMQGRS